MDRRSFVKKSVAGAAAATLGLASSSGADTASKPPRENGSSGTSQKSYTYDDFEFITTASVIFDPRCHELALGHAREPVLRRMPDGSLVCIHYTGGPGEPHDENIVVITHSTDDGESWTRGEVLFDHPVRGTWATELFMETDTPRLFVHTLDAGSHYTEIKSSVSVGSNDGKSWTEPVSVPGVPANFTVRRGLVLHDGTWLFPVYWQEQRGHWGWKKPEGGGLGWDPSWKHCSGVLRSTNQGAFFSLHGYMREKFALEEPTVIEVAPGHLMMLMRAGGQQNPYRSDSADGGVTWSPPRATDIPSPNSKMTLLRYQDTILLFLNVSEGSDWQKRYRVDLWISRDGGNTWPERTLLAHTKEGLDRVICYPDGFVDAERKMLYVALDSGREHYLLRIPMRGLVTTD